MNNKILTKARSFESEQEKNITEKQRPLFHLTPRVGWMNDPNGFCFYNGKYHLFYQYHPYSCVWGPMHWGHAISSDLIHWEPLPTALAPDLKNDKEGCFSGCALETEDGNLALIYTGVHKNKKDKKKNLQIQCLAIGDGINFKKERRPVIDDSQVPFGCSIEDFRDPKVVQNDNGDFILYAVNRNADGNGQVLAYKSKNLRDWKFCNVVLKNYFGLGRMWECPDLFYLDGKAVLMMSAQEVLQSDNFDSGNIGVCLIGQYDEHEHKFIKQKIQQVDRGLDFYAQQTIMSPDGRRIMIGWLQNWDICNYREKGARWFGQMSIPREIKINDGVLIQQPVREIESYRQNKQEINGLKLENEKCPVPQINCDCLDITVTVKKYDTNLSYFFINLFERDGHYARVYYNFTLEKAGIDRSRAGLKAALLHERSCSYKIKEGDDLKLRIITDRNSVEVFWGEGELVMSMSVYDEEKGSGLSFEVLGSAEINTVSYEIKDGRNEKRN